MKYCTQCGAPLPEPTPCCPVCGAKTPYAAAQPGESPAVVSPASQTSADEAPFSLPQQSAAPSGPHYRKVNTDYTKNGGKLTAVQYMLTFLLFSIPVVGLIAMLIFAFTEPGNPRRELARGYLLFCLIWVIIIVALVFLGIFVFFKSYPVEYYSDYYSHIPDPYDGYYSSPYDDYDDWSDYFDYYSNYGSDDQSQEIPHHSV